MLSCARGDRPDPAAAPGTVTVAQLPAIPAAAPAGRPRDPESSRRSRGGSGKPRRAFLGCLGRGTRRPGREQPGPQAARLRGPAPAGSTVPPSAPSGARLASGNLLAQPPRAAPGVPGGQDRDRQCVLECVGVCARVCWRARGRPDPEGPLAERTGGGESGGREGRTPQGVTGITCMLPVVPGAHTWSKHLHICTLSYVY